MCLLVFLKLCLHLLNLGHFGVQFQHQELLLKQMLALGQLGEVFRSGMSILVVFSGRNFISPAD